MCVCVCVSERERERERERVCINVEHSNRKKVVEGVVVALSGVLL